MEVGKLRVLDFYMAFPFRIEGFTFRQSQIGLKKISKAYEYTQPYGGIPDDMTLFLRMAPIQRLAMDTLASHDMIDREAYRLDVILAGEDGLPPELVERAIAFGAEHADLITVLQKLATDYPLLGEDGLKRRSGLMEYKYDVV